jgi:hypothetical protein
MHDPMREYHLLAARLAATKRPWWKAPWLLVAAVLL